MGILDIVHVLFTTANLVLSTIKVCILGRSERYFKLGFVQLFRNINPMFLTSYTL